MDSTLVFLVGFLLATARICGGQEDWDCEAPCKCKWISGRKSAECIQQNLTTVPNWLSSVIQSLDLTGNALVNLRRDAFLEVKLDNLQKLTLRDCGIETIHAGAFNGLKIVIEIDLSHNKIKVLRPGTFGDTDKLRILYLNTNLIQQLESGVFVNNTFLQRIDMSNNRLERIGQHPFVNLPGLHAIALNRNNLTHLRKQIFENLPKLGSLEVHENPWKCDCHLKEFRDWLMNTTFYTDQTTCAQPPNLAGRIWRGIKSEEFACRPKIVYVGPAPLVEIGPGDVTLVCKVFGTPLPEVTWWLRQRELSNSSRRYPLETKSYVLSKAGSWLNLTIPKATSADKGEYECRAVSPGGSEKKNVTLTVLGDVVGNTESGVSLALALGLGLTALLVLVLLTLVLCACYCCRKRSRPNEKSTEANAIEHHGLGDQEKSLITAINPVVKPPRRYEAAPSVTSHGTETTELNRTLLDNESVFAGGVGDDDRERSTPELDQGSTLPRGATYRQYPPDLLAFSGGRGASPTSQASTAPDSSRLPSQPGSFSPTGTIASFPPGFKTLPHNRSAAPYSSGPPVLPRHGYVTIPRRPRAPSWSSAPPTSPDGLEPVYDNLGIRTTADGSSVLSLNKSPEPSGMRGRPLPGTPTAHFHPAIQRSTPNILAASPNDRAAPEGAPEWPSKLADETEVPFLAGGGTLGRKIPPRPPPKPKKKSANGPLYEDEGEDGTEV
ncbi:leucine-rich repeat-containing protein 24-like [Neodiprion lecontei]|uniref:Leucine-rich repeat-containing protein 24-like n=1 Tax=Neodiprion lecontei TaxID=441921 RepID=A0ABM3GI86_NEOLC|nr:leucine-rich repeat-containing protein 24-like [Neodiprion lecontei]XP_046599976.1 leucine-rich repeat-containing protein 24-like [Neodiprion lecontei]XP_046599977.1 leucine-rich repeat-containing protein 24-like [Neodiprion lecontei]XP_046599978.1 leucine-rich repeat-containing protein 24-like [Neodiprion lecontei]XP_046599979.1 leucine-rich repeat-containing protein 24-like [Neodiprion lecontei]